MKLTFNEMDEAAALAVLSWRYTEPYDFYNPHPAEQEKDIQELVNPSHLYYTTTDEDGLLVAYFCFGREAQVPGGDYNPEALDIGCGLRPDLTGHGLGPVMIRAGLDFGRQKFSPQAFRTTVAAFNRRAMRACEKAGFLPVQGFQSAVDGTEFVILMRSA